jgi:hypothetical protein
MEKFGQAAPKLVNRVFRIVAYRYRKDLKRNYLSGQYLGKRSGQLQKSLTVWKKRGKTIVYRIGSTGIMNKASGKFDVSNIKLANIYEHAGGYTIRPKDAKALCFAAPDGSLVFTKLIRGQERPFMSDSAKGFNWDDAFRRTEEEIIGRETKRLAQEEHYVPKDDL